MELGELLQKAQIVYHNHQCDRLQINRLITDSRLAQPGDLFIGMPGTKVDGGTYAQEVLAKGAIAALVSEGLVSERPVGEQFSGDRGQIIAVKDVVTACAQVAAAFYGFPAQAMPLIGVTGTNGKTTTTHLIEFLAQPHFSTALFGTLYSRWQGYTDTAQNTTPFAITLQSQLKQALDAGTNLGILEVSSHALDQKRVWCCPFRVAVFTNLTQDHLDYHQNLESYFQAKALLFSPNYLPSHSPSRAIINLDDRFGLRLIEQCCDFNIPVWTYSLGDPAADFYATNLTYSPEGVSAILHTPQGEAELNSPLVGSFNVLNLMAAIASCLELNIPLAKIVEKCPQFQNVSGRVERVQISNQQDITVVVDYAHTPDSLQNILQALRPFTQRELICVFGCGGDRDRTKRPIMGQIAQTLADRVYITSDNPRTENPQTILDDILANVSDRKKLPQNVKVESDRQLAIQTGILSAQPGDTIVIAGKGHEDYQIIGKEKIHFDDRQVARQALQQRLSQQH